MNEVINHCAISRATLYRLIEKGLFPASRKISPGGRAVAWLKSDVEEWIETRVKH
ncbi:helix-turn-helix transcriptional regulator [Kluyvera cryocrescens]|uniref:helix-turn-helix transcriptional regulator n=1 Tax=Kluyvera cryocrescens TaxID=580 RepID=UPI002DB8558C|nr:AlpA family phage regulatory protein [Kluyvera cryocrescens]